MTKHKNTCFYCNTTLHIDLEAYKVISIGGKLGGASQNLENLKEKIVETFRAELCSCPRCHRKERLISEEIIWLSIEEVFTAIQEGRIISDNPEIEMIFKLFEFLAKGKFKLECAVPPSKGDKSA